jgi:iron(II)-dependent oxidoreductase
LKEILRRSNVKESGIGRTTPVNAYPLGKSPYGVMDMAGNIWEWQANYSGHDFRGEKTLSLRGGSWRYDGGRARVSFRLGSSRPDGRFDYFGFRVVLLPSG